MEQSGYADDFKIIKSRFGKYTLLSFENVEQLDLYNVKELAEIFKIGNGEGILDWVVDLSNIEFLDSSALGTLANQGMFLSKQTKRLIVFSPHSSVKHLFGVTGFGKIFSIVTDKETLSSH